MVHFVRVMFWMTVYWQNYEMRSVIDTTLRFIPICVFGVLANVLGSFIVSKLVCANPIRQIFWAAWLM